MNPSKNETKVVCIIACNRPEYFQLVLESLRRAKGIEEYDVIICLEPGCAANERIASTFTGCKEKHVIVNETKLGCHENIKKAFGLGFLISDFVIFLEDDITVAPDSLEYFEHCRREYKSDKNVMTVSGYSSHCRLPSNEISQPESSFKKIKRRQYYTPWMLATWSDRWQELVLKNWTGQDLDLNYRIRQNRYEVYPVLSRCNNIGLNGWHNVGNRELFSHQHILFWAETVNQSLLKKMGSFVETKLQPCSQEEALATVTKMYNECFHRNPDPTGISNYVPKVQKGEMDEDDLRTIFVGCEEYAKLHPHKFGHLEMKE